MSKEELRLQAKNLFLLKCEKFEIGSKEELLQLYAENYSYFEQMRANKGEENVMYHTVIPFYQSYLFLLVRLQYLQNYQENIYKKILSFSFENFLSRFSEKFHFFSYFLQKGEKERIKIILLYFLFLIEKSSFRIRRKNCSSLSASPLQIVQQISDLSIKIKSKDFIIKFYSKYFSYILKYLIDDEDLLADIIIQLVQSLCHEDHPIPRFNLDYYNNINNYNDNNINNDINNNDNYNDINNKKEESMIILGEKLFRNIHFDKINFHLGIFKKKKNGKKIIEGKIGYLPFLFEHPNYICKFCNENNNENNNKNINIENNENNNLELMKLIIEKYNFPYDFSDKENILDEMNDSIIHNPIIESCRQGNISLVRYLIGKYQTDNLFDLIIYFYRKPMLVECSKNGHLNLLKYLIEEEKFNYRILSDDQLINKKYQLKSFSIQKNYEYQSRVTLISIAAKYGKKEIIDYLLSLEYFQDIFRAANFRLINFDKLNESGEMKNREEGERGRERKELFSPVVCAMEGNHFDIALSLIINQNFTIVHHPRQTSFISSLVKIADLNLFEKFLCLFQEIDQNYLLEFCFHANTDEKLFNFVLNRFEFSELSLKYYLPLSFFNSNGRTNFNRNSRKKFCIYLEKVPTIEKDFKDQFLYSWTASFSSSLLAANFNNINL